MRISDWSSDVCSSDLLLVRLRPDARRHDRLPHLGVAAHRTAAQPPRLLIGNALAAREPELEPAIPGGPAEVANEPATPFPPPERAPPPPQARQKPRHHPLVLRICHIASSTVLA